jgi:phage tail sheath gpL-like
MDHFADDLDVQVASQMSGKVIGDDPVKGQLPPPVSVITPRNLKAIASALVDEYVANGLLQKGDQTKSTMIVQRNQSPSNRLSAQVALYPVDILNQVALDLQQV